MGKQSKALYIISVGGNDAYAVEDLGAERAAELSSDFALKMVQNLVEGGANYSAAEPFCGPAY